MIQAKFRGWMPWAHLPFIRLTTAPPCGRDERQRRRTVARDVVDPDHADALAIAQTAVASEPSRRSSVGTGVGVRGGPASTPGSGGAAARRVGRGQEPPEERLARHADADGEAGGHQGVEVGEQGQVVGRPSCRTRTRGRSRPRRRRRRRPASARATRKSRTSADDVVVGGVDLHGPGVAQHVHRDPADAVRRRPPGRATPTRRSRAWPRLDGGLGRRGVAGVDRDPHVRGQRRDDGQHPALLLVRVHRGRRRAGRLAADVDHRRHLRPRARGRGRRPRPGRTYRPPSEKESGVTLTTPITAGGPHPGAAVYAGASVRPGTVARPAPLSELAKIGTSSSRPSVSRSTRAAARRSSVGRWRPAGRPVARAGPPRPAGRPRRRSGRPRSRSSRASRAVAADEHVAVGRPELHGAERRRSCPTGSPSARAIWVARSMSFWAPVVGSPKTSSSAPRPPSSMASWSSSCGAGVEDAVLLGQGEGPAQGPAPGDDRHLVDRVAVGQDVAHQRVAGLVVGDDALLALRHDPGLLLGPGHHPLDGGVDVGGDDGGGRPAGPPAAPPRSARWPDRRR